MGFVSLSSSSDDVKRGTNISAMRKLLVIKTYLVGQIIYSGKYNSLCGKLLNFWSEEAFKGHMYKSGKSEKVRQCLKIAL